MYVGIRDEVGYRDTSASSIPVLKFKDILMKWNWKLKANFLYSNITGIKDVRLLVSSRLVRRRSVIIS